LGLQAPATQDIQDTPPPQDVFAIRTALVTVTNERGFPLTGLDEEDFEVTETGITRDVVDVIGDDEGREIFVLVDTSVGFRGEILSLQKGVKAFANALREPHEVMLVEFGGRPRHVAGPTSNRYQLERAAKKLIPRTEGAYLADAIADIATGITASQQVETEPPMVVIVASLTTDFSDRTYNDVYDLAIQSGASYYVVRYEGARSSIHAAQVENLLRVLTEQTGGSFARVLAATALEKALGKLATRLLEPRYRVSFLTEVEPRTRKEDLTISVFKEGVTTLLIQLLPQEKHVFTLPAKKEVQ
jgi:hypothetical protein